MRKKAASVWKKRSKAIAEIMRPLRAIRRGRTFIVALHRQARAIYLPRCTPVTTIFPQIITGGRAFAC